jgi:hypothetical protein
VPFGQVLLPQHRAKAVRRISIDEPLQDATSVRVEITSNTDAEGRQSSNQQQSMSYLWL